MPRTRDMVSVPGRDAAIADALTAWFVASARPLPWRTDLAEPPVARDPYHNLVAEAMAQQTQISRVVPAYERFITRFPTVESLAEAAVDEVLALWSGLGYYRRARHLHGAARVLVERYGGRVPSGVDELELLPGVGRYTAGSLASIVFGKAVPLVDGNVTRVLVRLEGRDDLGGDDQAGAARFAWGRAGELILAAREPGRFNEGMMELGATVCTPPISAPACERCPLSAHCRAFAEGTQQQIPRARQGKQARSVYCATVVAIDRRGCVLVEQRPEAGMWAGMWQCPTLEQSSRISGESVRVFAQMKNLDPLTLKRAGAFVHQTTHRTLKFTVYSAGPVACVRRRPASRWVKPSEMGELALSSAQTRAMNIVIG